MRPKASAAPSSSTRPPRKTANGSADDRQGRPAGQPGVRPALLPVQPRPLRGIYRPAPDRRLAPSRRTGTLATPRRAPRLPAPVRPAPATTRLPRRARLRPAGVALLGPRRTERPDAVRRRVGPARLRDHAPHRPGPQPANGSAAPRGPAPPPPAHPP